MNYICAGRSRSYSIYDYLAIIGCIIIFLSLSLPKSIMYISLIVFLVIYVITPIDINICLLIFYSFFTSAISFSFSGITISALCQAILILKIIYTQKKIPRIHMNLLVIVVLQIFAILLLNQSFARTMVMILNFSLMISLSSYKNKNIGDKIKWYFIFGLLGMLINAISLQPNFWTYKVYRFKGLWSDENFLGLLCCIGLSFCYEKIKNKNNVVLVVMIIIFLAYCGYRTYSLTFVMVLGVMGILILADVIRSDINIWVKIFFLLMIFVILIMFFQDYLMEIINNRLISSNDFTHGRSFTWKNAINAWKSNNFTLLNGIGYENVANYTLGKASHCTYLDIVVQFGIIGTFSVFNLFIKCIGKKNLRLSNIVEGKSLYIIILLIYAISLSMLSFDIMYVLVGITGVLIHKGEK